MPFDRDADGRVARGDAHDLQGAATAPWRQGEHLDARVARVVEDCERQRILDQERLGLAGRQQRQPEAFARRRREAGAVRAHRRLVEPLIVRERGGVAQHDAPVHRMRGAE